MLIVIFITFLFSYKLLNYVADFNTIKKKPVYEVIFLSIFFSFLFLPMSHINNDKISLKENRVLAEYSSLFLENGELNNNFGSSYNKWFNDRFTYRNFLIKLNAKIKYFFTGHLDKGYINRNGFSFLEDEYTHSYFKKIKNEDFLALVKFNNFCKEHNIELYVLLVPDKANIYLPDKQILKKDNYAQQLNKQIEYINKSSGIRVINLKSALQEESKNNYMFFKTEHHWTDDGAFVGYKKLMKEILKKHSGIYVLQEKDFTITYNNKIKADWIRRYSYGQNCWRLNIPKSCVKRMHKTLYRYFTHKNSKLLNCETVDVHYHKYRTYSYPYGADYKVILLGTSQSENLSEFIPYTFKNVKRLRINDVKDISDKEVFKIIKYYKNDILDYKPNIIIFCITYENISKLRNLFME